MAALFQVIAPVFLVVGFGYFCRFMNWLTDTHMETLMKFAQGFAIPCLLFQAVAGLDLKTTANPSLFAVYYLGATICFALGIVAARYLFQRPWTDSVAIGFCCFFANSVLLGLPISERAYGTDSLAANYAIVGVHAPYAYFVGITVMEIVRAEGKSALAVARQVGNAMFRNALVIGLALGAFVNVTGIALPQVVDDGISLMARAGLPVALFALGGILVRYKPEGEWRVIASVCVVVLLARPVITDGLSVLMPLSTGEWRSAVLTSAMPPGINAYIFASMYGVALRVAATSVLVSTVIAVFTLTGWLWYLG